MTWGEPGWPEELPTPVHKSGGEASRADRSLLHPHPSVRGHPATFNVFMVGCHGSGGGGVPI